MGGTQEARTLAEGKVAVHRLAAGTSEARRQPDRTWAVDKEAAVRIS